MRYVVLVLGLLIMLAASVALVVRSFQTGTVVEARTETQPAPAVPASTDRIGSTPASPPASANPPAAVPAPAETVREDRIPLAAQAPNLTTAVPPVQAPPRAQAPAEASPAIAARMPPDGRLDLSTAEIERVRHVLLTHNIMQLEETNFPLRVGAVVPENVDLSPLPIELSDTVPAYVHYSYVISQNQIAIVVTGKREIKLLIPVPAPA